MAAGRAPAPGSPPLPAGRRALGNADQDHLDRAAEDACRGDQRWAEFALVERDRSVGANHGPRFRLAGRGVDAGRYIAGDHGQADSLIASIALATGSRGSPSKPVPSMASITTPPSEDRKRDLPGPGPDPPAIGRGCACGVGAQLVLVAKKRITST